MKIKYILPIIFAFLLAACFDDDTTTGTQPISVISIDTTKLEKVYNINKFETRIITPEITQTDSSLPLSYEGKWIINSIRIPSLSDLQVKI